MAKWFNGHLYYMAVWAFVAKIAIANMLKRLELWYFTTSESRLLSDKTREWSFQWENSDLKRICSSNLRWVEIWIEQGLNLVWLGLTNKFLRTCLCRYPMTKKKWDFIDRLWNQPILEHTNSKILLLKFLSKKADFILMCNKFWE